MKSQSLINEIKVDSLSLLHGKPILVPTAGFSIAPKQLKDISSYGENQFFRDLRILTSELPIENIPDTDEIDECVKNYFLLLSAMKESEQFREIYIKALNFFTDIDACYSEEQDLLFYKVENEYHLITPQVLEAIKFILCKQYNIEIAEKEQPSDEIARKIIEKQKKAREKLAAIKQSTETSSIEFSDLVSAVAIQVPGLNILNIWNLTYYSFYNQFHRLRMVEDYDIGLKSIMAGADSKKIKLKHWIEPIQTKQE